MDGAGELARRKGDWLIYGAKLVEGACPRAVGKGTATFYLLAWLRR